MNALFLKDLAAKTHRGLRGRVEQGRSGGGLCYGYDVVKAFDGTGDPVRGGRAINETEAEVVRRVFREFAAGTSPRAIARRLNGEGISGPSGKLWTDSTIRGHAKRGTGLINNELYVGRLVWNRLRTSRIRRRASGCRGSTRRRTGSSRRSPSSVSSTMRCGRRSRTARARSRTNTRPLLQRRRRRGPTG